MSREYGMEEIIGVLEEGFEPEFIAEGLKVSIDFINQCKARLEERKQLNKIKSTENKQTKVNTVFTEKRKNVDEAKLTREQMIVSKMRAKYNNALFGEGKETTSPKGLSERQRLLAESIKLRINEAETLEEFKNIQQMISLKENRGKLDFLNMRLIRKRAEIEQKEIIKKYRNNMTPEIMQIVQSIINGNCDYEKAMEIIEEQAKQKVENKPKTRFTLTIKQEIQQTIIQIRKEIENNAKEYEMENSEKIVESLKQFDTQHPEIAIKTVVMSLMSKGEFGEAKQICNTYMKRENEELSKYLTSLKKTVRNNEVAKFVTQFLERETTPEEDKTFLEVLREKLYRENIKLSSVKLGEADRRTITLANICGNEISEYERY